MSVSHGLFDTHLHLDPEDDPQAVFAAGRAAGVELFLVAAGTYERAVAGQKLTQSEPGVFTASGLHPHDARDLGDRLPVFRELALRPGVVAIGEIGLDYYYDHSPRDLQRRAFAEFLGLAVELDMPAIVHCRDAFDDCFSMLREFSANGLRFELHSFTGSPSQAEEALAMGAFISFSGMVTFKKADNIRAIVPVVPFDRMLVETDSPYLAPVPYRGKRNQPAYVVEVVKRIAAEREVDASELARITTENGKRFFRLAPGA